MVTRMENIRPTYVKWIAKELTIGTSLTGVVVTKNNYHTKWKELS